MVLAKKWVLKNHFVGEPKDEDLVLEDEELPALEKGDVLFEALFLSVDPYMRPYTNEMKTPIAMIGQQLARVTETKNGEYPLGSKYLCDFGWRSHTVVNPNKLPLSKYDKPMIMPAPDTEGLPESLLLGTLGMPGATAYMGLLRICKPKEGETVLVNGGAGAVGSVVGQIAKIKGCKVVGYAGSDDKVAWMKELGFDHAFNYKTCDVNKTLKEAAPGGINCYFDNVGGSFSDTVMLQHMAPSGRIAVCGSISSYNATDITKGAEIYGAMIFKQLKMQGFIVYEYFKDYFTAIKEMVGWMKEGKLKTKEHTTEGIANMREAFYGMLKGANTGKAVIKA